ncbi:hypothetical protein M3G47_07035 [Corynebacterium sanguinis]|nr:hypothetical protein [Corynebacterium sanguinis]MCT1491636.1 hypothetical protein [Corynebacterium sanguinis]MCT2247830.1 hypothetical protein [Corynebacterium sanguinis]
MAGAACRDDRDGRAALLGAGLRCVYTRQARGGGEDGGERRNEGDA